MEPPLIGAGSRFEEANQPFASTSTLRLDWSCEERAAKARAAPSRTPPVILESAMNEEDEAFRGALMALLMHVRKRILDGEDPVALRTRLLEEESLEPALVDRVWVSLRPQLVSEQEDKGMRLRVLGGIWIVAGAVLAALVYRYPDSAGTLVKVLSFVSIAAGVFVFQMGSRAAALGTRISSMDWSIQTPLED